MSVYDDETAALLFIYDTVGDKIFGIRRLVSEISGAPDNAREYLQEWCSTESGLKEFLTAYEKYFMVENEMVAICNPHLETSREKAVDFYRDKLSSYTEPCDYMNFRGHIGQADRDVVRFINSFYHEEEFMDFLVKNYDVFVVFDDNTVFLAECMEEESVDFFVECLEEYTEGLYFMNLRGHINKASEYVQQYMKQYYPGKKFQEFLENNDDTFYLEDEWVYLHSDE